MLSDSSPYYSGVLLDDIKEKVKKSKAIPVTGLGGL
jgi:hypothetical protein